MSSAMGSECLSAASPQAIQARQVPVLDQEAIQARQVPVLDQEAIQARQVPLLDQEAIQARQVPVLDQEAAEVAARSDFGENAQHQLDAALSLNSVLVQESISWWA